MRKRKQYPTQLEVRSELEYSNGKLYRANKPGSEAHLLDRRIGTQCARTGKIRIKINGQRYDADRLAWIYVHGNLPSSFDLWHADGDASNYAVENLHLLPPPSIYRKRERVLSGVSGLLSDIDAMVADEKTGLDMDEIMNLRSNLENFTQTKD